MGQLNDHQRSFIKEMIAIKSVGGAPCPGAPYGKEPRAALDAFLSRAASEGFLTGVLDDRVGWCEIGSGSKMMGIVCHLDVVPEGEGWEKPPFEATFENGMIYGRGIVDDKGPAIVSFLAMKELKDSGTDLGMRVRLILGTDEERTCSCVEYYDGNGEIPDISITPDAEFPVIYAEKGILHVKISDPRPAPSSFTAKGGDAANMVPPSASAKIGGQLISVKGKMAHASKPELGINAIELLPSALPSEISLPLINFVGAYDPSSICSIKDDSGKLTSNIGILRINSEEQYMIIDIRYPVTASVGDIVSRVSEQASEYGLITEIQSHMAPVYKDKDSDAIRALTEVWKKHMKDFDGYKDEYSDLYSEPLAIGGGTYARHMRNTIAFGIQTPWAEDQCHQANEHISENDFLKCRDVIKDAILKIAGALPDPS
ncbi:MAG: Sapep family Mn(2+)-dependent dipeptidase [Clostridiales bacterium]|nr:Sapep family Mn(2+)-dependent dipeptidase [Clostridiales bacterium]